MPELFVTNFNRNFTGVSSTAANVVRKQAKQFDLRLVGYPLPGCPDPITASEARALSRKVPAGRSHVIWHVRRNTEMRAAIWARDALRLPIRIVFTSAAQRRHSALPRWLIRQMDAVVATTEAAAAYVPHVRAVVPHGVDTDLFHPAEDRAALWTSLGFGGQRGIATIGRIRPEKGTDLFISAMIDLLPRQPDTVALIIGRATREHQSFLSEQKARIDAAGLSDRILFPGEIPAAELPNVLPAMSLVMQMPRYEGYGMAPLEGMASGVPFVGSDTGYYRAFSAQGRCGHVVPLEDVAAAVAHADRLLNDPDLLAKQGRDARDVAHCSFSIRNEADGIGRVYDTLWS